MNGGEGRFDQTITDWENWSFVPMVISISIFELVCRIHLPQCKIVSYIGKATFMVYLLHDNELVRGIWRRTDWISVLYYLPKMYLLMLVQWIGISFLVGVFGYFLYAEIFKKIDKLISEI